jgi:hypothetical protein
VCFLSFFGFPTVAFGMSEEVKQSRFRVDLGQPDGTRHYLVVVDLVNLAGEAIGYPKERAAQGINLIFNVDIPQSAFKDVTEAEISKMELTHVPCPRHDMAVDEILAYHPS